MFNKLQQLLKNDEADLPLIIDNDIVLFQMKDRETLHYAGIKDDDLDSVQSQICHWGKQ